MTYHELPAWLQKIARERCEAYTATNLHLRLSDENISIYEMFQWYHTKEGHDFWLEVSRGIIPTLAEYEARFKIKTDNT